MSVDVKGIQELIDYFDKIGNQKVPKKALKKATDYTEQLIDIVDKYTEYFTKKDLSKYNSLKKKFNKNN